MNPFVRSECLWKSPTETVALYRSLGCLPTLSGRQSRLTITVMPTLQSLKSALWSGSSLSLPARGPSSHRYIQGGATYQREREGDGLSLQQRGTFQQVKGIHRTACSGRHMAGEIYIQSRPLSRNAVGVKVTRGVLAHGPAQVSSTSRASAVSLFPKWGAVLGLPHTQSGMN